MIKRTLYIEGDTVRQVQEREYVENSLYVNPIYFCSTNRIPLNLYLIFQKHFDEVMPAWVVERYREQHGKKTN